MALNAYAHGFNVQQTDWAARENIGLPSVYFILPHRFQMDSTYSMESRWIPCGFYQILPILVIMASSPGSSTWTYKSAFFG